MSWGSDLVSKVVPGGSGATLKLAASVRGGSKSEGPSPVWLIFNPSFGFGVSW
mgnify:FL=1